MTTKQLIARLKEADPTGNLQVMIHDSVNGGGVPREINGGPLTRTVLEQDANETADCEDLVGREIVAMGFGCY